LPRDPSTLARLRNWATSLVFVAVFFVILLLFDPLQRLARLLGLHPHEVVVGWMQRALLRTYRLSGARVHVERSPLLSPRRPYLVVSNHQSAFDVPLLGVAFAGSHLKFVAKRELERGYPSISYNLRRGGNAIVDREDRWAAFGAIVRAGRDAQRRGVSLVIFPEGTRSVTGELLPMKPLGTLGLLRAAPALEVVPVTIDGTWWMEAGGLWPVPFGATVRLRLGDPIPRRPDEDGVEVLCRAGEEIRRTLLRWRGQEETARAPAAPSLAQIPRRSRVEDLV
jgi:1-acyl-sn-glycerol-3-phosphate acyltransferase